ncbi:MAG: hypothetical protein K2Q17_14495 [Nitrospiraceae bacterium]|uniref:hypothetical protein n=1 Tax=Nitrospira cf. moscoviensis SBR1015 TaxID=96242 RepID=UPI000A0AEEEF|nr:hypothetical protein [Nitrospira cf. moscoviensis SBR1015]MBY0248869.1 hypothetical protein [Nitrospiraceae bacterium]OQW31732.1 MAG: hypothetical protein A4E20_14605 [Nitrospira sp. SG-bin2]
MMPVLMTFQRAVWLPFLLILATGCAQSSASGPAAQEYLGCGIVSGTLGAQQRATQSSGEPAALSVIGQVQALEGAAYLIRDAQGKDIRIPHDQNTRIDRPAHVGDRIQCWLDHRGRAVEIRSLDENGQ